MRAVAVSSREQMRQACGADGLGVPWEVRGRPIRCAAQRRPTLSRRHC